MATLDEITYNIAQLAGKDTDTAYINRVKFSVMYHRSLLCRRDFDRHGFIAPQFALPLGCIKMVEADSAQCFGIDLPCNLVKSKVPIPAPLRLRSGNAFLYVGTVDGRTPYSRMDMEDLRDIKYLGYSQKLPRYIYWDEHLFVFNAKPDKLKVNYVPDDPSKLDEFVDCNGNSAFDVDEDSYPISADMIQQITQSILNGEVRVDQPDQHNEIRNTDDGV